MVQQFVHWSLDGADQVQALVGSLFCVLAQGTLNTECLVFTICHI